MRPLTSKERSGAAEPPDRSYFNPSVIARPGTRTKPRRRRTRLRQSRIAKALVVILLLGVVGSAVLALVAYSGAKQAENQIVAEFTTGQAQLEQGKALLQKATKDQSQAELDQARVDFISARQHFGKAPDILAHNPSLGLATFFRVPYVAPRLQAVRSLSLMGTSLADAALVGVDIDSILVHPNGGSTSSGGFLAVLNLMSPKVPIVKQDLLTARGAALAVDPTLLPSSQASALKKAIDSIDFALTSVDQLATLLPVASEILGGNGPRSYLIEQATPAELRAGGGYIGSVSVITANAGSLKLGLSGGVETWEYPRAKRGQPGYVEPPGPLRSFIGTDSFGLADSNFFPDFKTSAQTAEQFAQSEMHIKPDGIISIDPEVVAALLTVTGPLAVPGYNVTVDGKTFSDWLFQQQYALKNVTGTKKAIFSAIASELIPKVVSLPPSRWPDLMTQLNNLASQRHLQVFFNNAPAEAIMDRYGWSGTLNPRKVPDVFYEVESNLGATKANHFVTRAYRVDLSVVNGKLHHVITVDLKNSEPRGYEGGNNYNCYVRFYVPANATGLSHGYYAPNEFPDTSAPPGYAEFDGWLEIDVKPSVGYGVRTLVFEYDTAWSDAGPYTIYWQKQPGTGNDQISVSWKIGGGSYSANGVLSTDKQIELTPSSLNLVAGQAGTATVPSLSL